MLHNKVTDVTGFQLSDNKLDNIRTTKKKIDFSKLYELFYRLELIIYTNIR